MYGIDPDTDPHRRDPEVHYRLYDSPNQGPTVICVQDFDYPDYAADRFMTAEAYTTETEAEQALARLHLCPICRHLCT